MNWRAVLGVGVWALWAAPFAACGGTVGSARDRTGTQDTGGTGGSSGGTGGATGGQSSGGSSAGGEGVGGQFANGGCGVTSTTGEPEYPALYVLLDQSTSMGCPILAGGDRWSLAKLGIQTFAADPTVAGIGLGIGYFGSGQSSSCNGTDYQTPDVEVAPLPDNASVISRSLDGKKPSTNSPTAAALSGAIAHATTWHAVNGPRALVVVLVTDGQPDACGTVQDVANAAAAGLAGGQAMTRVVAIASPGSACPLDPNPLNVSDLETVAQAGGTEHALIVDTSSGAVGQFVDALKTIAARARAPCRLRIPAPKDGQTFDPNKVNVQYTTRSGTNTVPYRVKGRSECDPSTGGWYYAGPFTVALCPSTCTLLGTQPGAAVSLLFGCSGPPIFR